MNAIEVLGVYQLPVTEEMFELAMKEKYPDIPKDHLERAAVEPFIREELDSCVLIEIMVNDRPNSRFRILVKRQATKLHTMRDFCRQTAQSSLGTDINCRQTLYFEWHFTCISTIQKIP